MDDSIKGMDLKNGSQRRFVRYIDLIKSGAFTCDSFQVIDHTHLGINEVVHDYYIMSCL